CKAFIRRSCFMLSTRMKTIFRELMAAETPLTGKYLADVNQVSSRTIREDMKILDSMLRSQGAFIDSIMGQGYQLGIADEPQFRSYLKEVSGDVPDPKTAIPRLPEDRIA